MKYWLLLLGMIVTESFSTLLLKMSDGFSRPLIGGTALLGYLIVLYLFSFILKVIPASVAYAVWTGLGTLLVALAGWVWFGEAMSASNIAGIALIVYGVIQLNRSEKTSA
ncbi:DMT family transporter [Samsonia erythrinae]|uniref:Small multidrug resistance pump n=1 Tax=Samsonia erythrinae TaxID=160434 RepID=A0A4R3VLV4_9GAMM|nr:multidrug efflux SMR transporter [Samsonia erythrinae]TCV04893.1 small multidrug resistance pump [Samsonia erythrinae]